MSTSPGGLAKDEGIGPLSLFFPRDLGSKGQGAGQGAEKQTQRTYPFLPCSFPRDLGSKAQGAGREEAYAGWSCAV